jgi:hypothetical protein
MSLVARGGVLGARDVECLEFEAPGNFRIIFLPQLPSYSLRGMGATVGKKSEDPRISFAGEDRSILDSANASYMTMVSMCT